MQPNAVDMSRWSGELTAEEAACLKAAGVRLVIVGCGHPNGAGLFARQQAEAWLAAGGEFLDAYIYLYFAGDPVWQVRQALAVLDGLPVRRWWLDAEDTESPQLTPEQREAFLSDAEDALNERPRGVYTGRWWWVPNMGNAPIFADLPLWNSWYDGDPDEDGLPYGGWGHSAIEQYQGTTMLCGQSVDLNYAKDLPEEDDMETKKQLDELNAAMVKREDLRRLAAETSEEGYARMLQAHETLTAAGLLK